MGKLWQCLVLVGWVVCVPPVMAQTQPDPEALATIRAEIDALATDINGLRGELLAPDPQTTGIVNPAPLRARVDQTALEVQRLQAAIEALTVRIEQVVADGTNRIGDLEFRLHELEGGDFSTYKDPPPLGEGAGAADTSELVALRPKLRNGVSVTDVRPAAQVGLDADSLPPAATPVAPEPQLDIATTAPAQQFAQTEQQSFDAALALLQSGDFAAADQAFGAFLATYPNSTLIGDAAYWRGGALAGLGNWNAAARSYLDSFSGAPQGPKAPEALFRLGQSLGRLGQVNEACLTLAEVPLRYPNMPTDLAQRAEAERRALSCS